MDKRLGFARGTLAAPSPDGELVFTASAPGTNRYGFSLNPKRWKIDNFNNNPVILWMHMDHMPPIGRGRASSESGGIRLGVTFDRSDPFAVQIENKYRQGFMNAVSVGFDFVDGSGKPIADWYRMSAEQISNEAFYDLAEVSAVPVPADPNALIRQKHALAADFDLWTPEFGFDVTRHLSAPSVTYGTGTSYTYPTLPGNGDVEIRLRRIEEALSRLAPEIPEDQEPESDEESQEEAPENAALLYTPEALENFLETLKL